MSTENIIPFERRAKVPQAPASIEPGLGDVLRGYAAKGHRKAEMPMDRDDTIGDLMDIMEEVAAADYHRMTITTAGMAGTDPANLPGVARYIEDGWRISDVRIDGTDISVDIIKNPNLLGGLA